MTALRHRATAIRPCSSTSATITRRLVRRAPAAASEPDVTARPRTGPPSVRGVKGATWGGRQGPWQRSGGANAKGAGLTGYTHTRVKEICNILAYFNIIKDEFRRCLAPQLFSLLGTDVLQLPSKNYRISDSFYVHARWHIGYADWCFLPFLAHHYTVISTSRGVRPAT